MFEFGFFMILGLGIRCEVSCSIASKVDSLTLVSDGGLYLFGNFHREIA